jgi:flagellar protein FliO/FliZ
VDYATYLRFLGALAFVLVLIWLATWAIRRFGLIRALPRSGAARRLSVVEVASVDAKRKLVLVRRDETEHLVLLGPTSDLIVERAIGARAEGSTK